MKRTVLSDEEQLNWERDIQLACLKGIAQQDLTIEDLAFHGGTSLRFSWGSPRFSEDLDFMMSKDRIADLDEIISKTTQIVKKELLNLNSQFKIDIKEKKRRDGQLMTYMISLSRPDVIGSAKVKIEFWRVENDFLKDYKTTLRSPNDKIAESRIYTNDLLPAADLKSAYCDKLVALSTRPYLKWRDIFDIWWLRTQNDINPLKEDDKFIEYFHHNLSAYSLPENKSLTESLQRYLTWDRDDIIEQSKTDLQRWLPKNLWNKLYPQTIEEMISLVETDVQKLLNILSTQQKIKL